MPPTHPCICGEELPEGEEHLHFGQPDTGATVDQLDSASEVHEAALTAAYNRFAAARDAAWNGYQGAVARASEAFDLDVINANAAYDADILKDARCTNL